MMVDRNQMSYVIYGREIAPTTQSTHLQGYLELPKKLTLRRVKAMFLEMKEKPHLEIAKGSQKQNQDYCSKDGDWEEYGTPMQQGKRTDIESLQQYIQEEKVTVREVADQFFPLYLRYHQAVERYLALQVQEVQCQYDLSQFQWNVPLNEFRQSIILWGAPGIGKTCYAQAILKKNYLFINHLDQLKGFDANFHAGIIFDDMSFTHLPREAQIALVDQEQDRAIHIRYNIALIPKGTPKIFTTNIPNGEIVDLSDGAIKRRVSVHHLIKV